MFLVPVHVILSRGVFGIKIPGQPGQSPLISGISPDIITLYFQEFSDFYYKAEMEMIFCRI